MIRPYIFFYITRVLPLVLSTVFKSLSIYVSNLKCTSPLVASRSSSLPSKPAPARSSSSLLARRSPPPSATRRWRWPTSSRPCSTSLSALAFPSLLQRWATNLARPRATISTAGAAARAGTGGGGGSGGRWAVAGAVGGEGVGGVWVVVVRWWSGGVFVAGVWRGFVQESVR